MTIIDNVTWVEGLIGGGLIGLASAFFLLLNGQIAGISGIVSGLFSFNKNGKSWRALFVLGLILGGLIINLLIPQNTMQAFFPSHTRSAVAGLLVGVGTVVGNGCTSGHGVCGISRFSLRSIIATAIFMTTGFLTLWLGA